MNTVKGIKIPIVIQNLSFEIKKICRHIGFIRMQGNNKLETNILHNWIKFIFLVDCDQFPSCVL